MWSIPQTKETLMANGVIVQIAVISVLAAISISLLLVYTRQKARREPSHTNTQTRVAVKVVQQVEKSERRPAKSEPVAALQKPLEKEREATSALKVETADTRSTANLSSSPDDANISVAFQAPPTSEGSNQRILAGISENLRRSVIKPVPTYSTVSQPEMQRDPEYVRVKKRIITPHGQVRFSILKDSISVNMLAVFRRAFLDWKTPYDLIAFLPPYLEPEAEIFHDQLLLIGTAGHHEKLAIPIRSFNLDSNVLDCFDFITDDRTATNTPAVLVVSDDEIEIVTRGVITQPVFLKPERDPSEVKFLVERYPQALQNG
jgi:hypothetical protein